MDGVFDFDPITWDMDMHRGYSLKLEITVWSLRDRSLGSYLLIFHFLGA